MNLMRFKVWYFVFSLLIILPGLYFLVTSGLRLGIDFTGGALLEYQFEKNIDINNLKQEITKDGIEVGSITISGDRTYIFRTKQIEQDKLNQLKKNLTQKYGKIEE